MSGPLSKLEARIEELEQASEELREVTRGAHAATKDLRAERKGLSTLLADLKYEKYEVRQILEQEWRLIAHEVFSEWLVGEIDAIRESVKASEPTIVAVVEGEIRRIADEWLKGPGQEASWLP